MPLQGLFTGIKEAILAKHNGKKSIPITTLFLSFFPYKAEPANCPTLVKFSILVFFEKNLCARFERSPIISPALFLAYCTIEGTVILLPKNSAFKNSLFVPYQKPLKFGLSANKITLPAPSAPTSIAADPFTFLSDEG